MTKIKSKNNLSPHRHFTEHLVCVNRKNAVEVQFVLGNIESFDPVTQELYRHLPATIHTQELEEKIKFCKLKSYTGISQHRRTFDRENEPKTLVLRPKPRNPQPPWF
jgi:hypothetical protein